MKKMIKLLVLPSLVLLFSGCSGEASIGDPVVYVDTPIIIVEEPIYVEPVVIVPAVVIVPTVVVDPLITLFLVDDQGFSYADIPYTCDSMDVWSKTAYNGEFSFYEGEDCDFDFYGLDGDYNDPLLDDIVHIVDDLGYGKGGISYDCLSFGVSSTYTDGSFEYDSDDECRFYL